MAPLIHNHLLSIIVGAPFVAALVLLLLSDRQRILVRLVSVTGAAVSLAGAVQVALTYDKVRGGLQRAESFPLIPSIGVNLSFAVDGWGVSLLLLTGIIIVTGAMASWTVKDRAKDFYVLLLVLVSGVFGVFVSQDMMIFFLFYEIAVLPMYLLIGIWGSRGKVDASGPFAFIWKRFDVGGREYAAMKLTLMLLVGSAAILIVIFMMYFKSGGKTFDLGVLGRTRYPYEMQLWAFPLCWLGFGSLAGVFPFHTWSPDGHAAAPTAVSMLHAGVLMKLGAFGVIRVGMMMLPEGALYWAPYVGGIAVLNVLYGAVSAASQKDLKYVIAYSSVSHMGVVMLGAATLTVDGWNGAVYQMFAHGMMTGLFFALVGLVYERAHTRLIPAMGGFAKNMPGVAAFFTLAGLSSLGLPGLAGFVAEFLVFLGAWQSAHWWWAIPGILGAWVTAVYVLRASRNIFFGDGPSKEFHELEDAHKTEWFALWALGACLIVFGCFPRLILDFIHLSTTQYLPIVVNAAAKVAVVP
ncbi:MAG: NADH-quinone oxidoreductase subunit M [Deltaproteobacteria bacterium]|nr:NADH-quinone oxidoreductase subunit M [Deltaproteobacteria bacterium]